MLESVTPIIFWKRELLQDSGGPGRSRGGLGQRVEIESMAEQPVDAMFQFDRVDHPAQGLFGGCPADARNSRSTARQPSPARGA